MRTRGREHELKDTTLTEARAMNLGPSVTTALQLLAKPMLIDWQIEQGIKAALSEAPAAQDEAYADYMKRLKRKANEIASNAADMGTQVHRAIGTLARGAGRELALDVGVAAYQVGHAALERLLDSGLVIEQSEASFASPLGYGGTLDIIGSWQGRACVADIKTQEFETEGSAKFYPEHPLQLAGYAVGYPLRDYDRVSIIVSRTNPGVVAVRNWSTYESKNGNGWPNERADAAWLAVLEAWFALNQWRPAW